LAVFSIFKEYDALMINIMYLTILFIKNMKNPLPQAQNFGGNYLLFTVSFKLKPKRIAVRLFDLIKRKNSRRKANTIFIIGSTRSESSPL
jgi:hypothetical protein